MALVTRLLLDLPTGTGSAKSSLVVCKLIAKKMDISRRIETISYGSCRQPIDKEIPEGFATPLIVVHRV